jgi:hypothetical protein
VTRLRDTLARWLVWLAAKIEPKKPREKSEP